MRTRRRFTRKPRDPRTLVVWLCTKGAQTLTCRVDEADRQPGFAVSLLPHWDATKAVVERFAGPVRALARHAGLVSDLRDAGWRVAAYTE